MTTSSYLAAPIEVSGFVKGVAKIPGEARIGGATQNVEKFLVPKMSCSLPQ